MATVSYVESSADTLSGDINASNKAFLLSRTPDAGSVVAFINNTVVSITLDGSTVTLSEAPISGDTVYVRYTVGSAESVDVTGTITALSIINTAMRRINKLGAGQTIASSDLSFCLTELNLLIDHWRSKKNYVLCYDHNSYAWTTSQQTYTIGEYSADFNGYRPIIIERANLVRVDGSDEYRVPLAVVEMDEYSRVPEAADTAEEPVRLYYRRTLPNGTLYPHPYPENTTAALANKLELFTWSHLSKFSSSSSAVYLAEGWEDAICYTLAERIAPTFGVALSEDFKRTARLSRASIGTGNKSKIVSTHDSGMPRVEYY